MGRQGSDLGCGPRQRRDSRCPRRDGGVRSGGHRHCFGSPRRHAKQGQIGRQCDVRRLDGLLESIIERTSVGPHRVRWEQQPAGAADEHPQRGCARRLERRHPGVHGRTARIRRLSGGPACRRRDLSCPEVGAQGGRPSGWCGRRGRICPRFATQRGRSSPRPQSH